MILIGLSLADINFTNIISNGEKSLRNSEIEYSLVYELNILLFNNSGANLKLIPISNVRTDISLTKSNLNYDQILLYDQLSYNTISYDNLFNASFIYNNESSIFYDRSVL